jgi:ABC-type polar amino acid transport system ATPase subunit
MTVLRNVVEAPVWILGMARAEAEARAIGLLLMVGLADNQDHCPVQLSGGQQQRVAIARSLAMGPRCFSMNRYWHSIRSWWAKCYLSYEVLRTNTT